MRMVRPARCGDMRLSRCENVETAKECLQELTEKKVEQTAHKYCLLDLLYDIIRTKQERNLRAWFVCLCYGSWTVITAGT